MASIANDPNGRRRILFVGTDGKRKAIRLGKVPIRVAVVTSDSRAGLPPIYRQVGGQRRTIVYKHPQKFR